MGSGLTPRDMERLPDVLLQTVIRYCIGLPRPVQSVFGEANSQSNQTRDNAVCPPFYTPTLCLSIPPLSARLCDRHGLTTTCSDYAAVWR